MCCLLLQALCNSGVVFRELERLEEAVTAYEAALAVSADTTFVVCCYMLHVYAFCCTVAAYKAAQMWRAEPQPHAVTTLLVERHASWLL
jgi:hypothetical protein